MLLVWVNKEILPRDQWKQVWRYDIFNGKNDSEAQLGCRDQVSDLIPSSNDSSKLFSHADKSLLVHQNCGEAESL